MPRRSDTEPKSTNRAAWLLQSRQMFYCGRGEPWSATSLSPCHGIKEGIYVQALSASPWQQNGVCGNDLVRIRLINGDWRQRFSGGGAYKVSLFFSPAGVDFVNWDLRRRELVGSWHSVTTFLRSWYILDTWSSLKVARKTALSLLEIWIYSNIWGDNVFNLQVYF